MTDANVLLKESRAAIEQAQDLKTLDDVRVSLLGKKGRLTSALKSLGQASPEERQTLGKALNEVKREVDNLLTFRKGTLENAAESEKLASEKLDVTLPARAETEGGLHPITKVTDEMVDIFSRMGFSVRTGPLIEDDEHNFTALNIPPSHPARQMHDTFYVRGEEGEEDGGQEADPSVGEAVRSNAEARRPEQGQLNSNYVLRTHTSPVQIRTMKNEEPPIRIIAPGATFRCDSDLTHTPMFHQVEGLVIDKNIHMGHLKGCISEFLRAFFEIDDLPVRFRPSFFPFTEPSAEVDIGCERSRDSLKVGVGEDWLEIMGCGMVHPNVLRNCGLDPDEWQGFAFGMGVERLAMLKYNIPDLRTFFESDMRWLDYYGFSTVGM